MRLYNDNRDWEENMSGDIPLSSIHIWYKMIDEARGGEKISKSLKVSYEVIDFAEGLIRCHV